MPAPAAPAPRRPPPARSRSRLSFDPKASRRSAEPLPSELKAAAAAVARPAGGGGGAPPLAAHAPPLAAPAARRARSVDSLAVSALEAAGYLVVGELSDGTFGAVYRATRLRDGLEVAAKAVKRSRLGPDEEASVRSQAASLAGLRHRHVVALVDAFEDAHYLFHVFEFLHGGDLFDRLEARGRPFAEPQALALIAQALRAVGYLHARRAAHRDIKLENFVFETRPAARSPVLKLIDFDLLLVRPRGAPAGATCTDMCGTVLYVPPELAAGNEYVPEEADMWAVGVVLYVLLSFEMPFQGRLPRDILRDVREANPSFSAPAWRRVSTRTRRLVESLLSKSGAARPSAEEALARIELIATGPVPAPRGVSQSLRSVSARLGLRGRRAARRRRFEALEEAQAAQEAQQHQRSLLVQERASQDELDALLCYDSPRPLSSSYAAGHDNASPRAVYSRSGIGAERVDLHRGLLREEPVKRRLLASSGSDRFAEYAAAASAASKRRTEPPPRARRQAKGKRFSRFPSERPLETGYC